MELGCPAMPVNADSLRPSADGTHGHLHQLYLALKLNTRVQGYDPKIAVKRSFWPMG